MAALLQASASQQQQLQKLLLPPPGLCIAAPPGLSAPAATNGSNSAASVGILVQEKLLLWQRLAATTMPPGVWAQSGLEAAPARGRRRGCRGGEGRRAAPRCDVSEGSLETATPDDGSFVELLSDSENDCIVDLTEN